MEVDNDAEELILLATSCGVCATHMAVATDYMLSERTFQRIMKNKKLPVSALHLVVLNDILMALRYAYAQKTLPIKLSSMTGVTTQARASAHKQAVAATLQDAIHESRKISSPSV